MSRTRRRAYTGAKRYVRSCRNHGSCDYCKNTRTHTERVRLQIAKEKERERV